MGRWVFTVVHVWSTDSNRVLLKEISISVLIRFYTYLSISTNFVDFQQILPILLHPLFPSFLPSLVGWSKILNGLPTSLVLTNYDFFLVFVSSYLVLFLGSLSGGLYVHTVDENYVNVFVKYLLPQKWYLLRSRKPVCIGLLGFGTGLGM